MSLTPSVPDFKANMKSFWQRPEGKGGIITLLALAGVGIWGFSLALPWLTALVWGTLQLAVAGVLLFLLLAAVTSKRLRCIVSNIFQLTMRKIVGIIVEIDPIGIAENTLDNMISNNEKFSKAIEGTAGAKKSTENQIKKNTDIIDHANSLKHEAEKEIAQSSDELVKRRYQLNVTMQLNEIGRRLKSNEKLQVILNQTTKLYTMLCRWQELADFQIENLRAEIANNKEERKAILEAYAGMTFAQKIIKGDPEQLKMLNASLEYMADDNARKLGAMEDFARYSEKFLTQMDLEQGASASDAEKMLAQFEQKLLSAGAPQDTVPTKISVNATPTPVLRNKDNSNYF